MFPYGKTDLDTPVIAFLLSVKLPQNFVTVQGLPLPREKVTYETWAPLKSNARHDEGEVTDIWQIAVDYQSKSKGHQRIANPVSATLAQQEEKRLKTEVVRKWYGEAGVKALGLD